MKGTFKALFENSMDAILVISPDGAIVAANRATENMLGMGEVEIIRAGTEGLINMSNRHLEKLLEDGNRTGHATGEFVIESKNGQKFPVEISSNVFQNEDGEKRNSLIIHDISQRKAVEERIRALNEKLQDVVSRKTILANTVLDSSPEAVIAIDKNMCYIVFNKTAENITGLKRENVIGKKFPEERPFYKGMPIESYYQDALSGKSFNMSSVAYSVSESDGEGYFDASFAPMKDENGEIIGMVATFKETTEQVEAALKLAESQKRFRLLAEHSTDLIYVTDPQHRYTYASPSFKRITGYEPAEIVGHSVLEHVHPEDVDKMLRYREDRKTSTDVRSIVYRRKYKNGSYHWMESTSQGIYDAETGELVEIQSAVHDIHDRILLEDELKESERKFRLLAEQSTDIIYRTDRKGVILYASPSIEKITGFRPDEVIGHSFFEYVHPDDLQHIWATRDKQIEEDKIFALVYRRITKDGKNLWVESTSKGIRDPETGEVTEFQTSIRDVTERMELQKSLEKNYEELQHTNSELEQFIFILSHDLSEPLRAIALFSDRLIDLCPADSPDTKKYSEYINAGIGRMRAMLEDLRDYQLVIREKDDFGEVEITGILNHVRERLKAVIESSRAQLLIGAMPTVYGNRTQLNILFHCLMDNSLKFRREGVEPILDIRAEKKGDKWQFAVKDNGIGIKQEYENKVFAIFEQLHTRDKYPGTGIGLSIAKKIVENHSGHIWFHSLEGHGTTFYFTLPASKQSVD